MTTVMAAVAEWAEWAEWDSDPTPTPVAIPLKLPFGSFFFAVYFESISLSKSEARSYDDGFMARIDGLNHLVNTFFEVVLQRFVKEDSSAFARTLTFRVPSDGGEKMLEDAYEELYQKLAAIEDSVGDAPSVAVDLSVLWAKRPETI